MSIYSTPIPQLGTSDLAELLQEQAVENTRLEFKREVPDKDETLKKLSSLANTFGGFVVIGAAAQSKDGRIEELCGVDEVPGYKQKIVDWCFKECSPPIMVDVSGPIPTSVNSGKVCYVISVEESDVAPHFLNGRKGVWIRTNEFSGRYDAQLADEGELQQLFHRRQQTLERRQRMVERARQRFLAYRAQTPMNLGKPTALCSLLEVCIVPRFPARQICAQEDLPKLIRQVQFDNYRSVGFPRLKLGILTQHESAIVRQPLTDLSYFELNVWGMLFYAEALDETNYEDKLTGIHLYEFIGHLLMFLEHAAELLKRTGLVGPILVQASLLGIQKRTWLHSSAQWKSMAVASEISGLDDAFGLSSSTTVENLVCKRDEIAMELVRSIFFSLNWNDLIDGQEKLESLIQAGHRYNKG